MKSFTGGYGSYLDVPGIISQQKQISIQNYIKSNMKPDDHHYDYYTHHAAHLTATHWKVRYLQMNSMAA